MKCSKRCYLAVSYYVLIGKQVPAFRTIAVPSFSVKQSNSFGLLDCGDEGKAIPTGLDRP
jgi:hypothetical protein